MISIEVALGLIAQHARPLNPTTIPLATALNRVLAGDVISDIDSPPYDKALMDGYAVQSQDVAMPKCVLRVLETVTAGEVPRHTITKDTATRIMTGSPLPSGADAVVVIEQTETKGNQVVVNSSRPTRPEQNLLRQGTCISKGDAVVQSTARLGAGQIGLLAEVGADPVNVYPAPTVNVLVTGNELVAANTPLKPGMIRNSNGPMLEALAHRDFADVASLGIGRDNVDELRGLIERGLASDVLILSGGVSAGDLDLVPRTLAACGVTEVFHKVNIKPGKPIWFGVGERTLVFGLPGNPVSSFVCYLLFVRAAIMALQGQACKIAYSRARIAHNFVQPGDRPVYYPARRTDDSDSEPRVTLLPWKGSADLRTLADADCLACLPPKSNFMPEDILTIMDI